MYLSLSLSFCKPLTNGQVMSPHHFDQMSQRSQVSRIALHLQCSLIVFVFVLGQVSQSALCLKTAKKNI